MDDSSSKKDKRSLEDSDISSGKLGRRSSIGMIGATIGAAVAAVGIVSHAEPARAQVTDRDPNDPSGRGRGCSGRSDSDPRDPAGCGRSYGSGVTDRDPNDPAGNGRGYSGCSDSDPNDAGGRGSHCYRSCSDSDPYDQPGRGRRC